MSGNHSRAALSTGAGARFVAFMCAYCVPVHSRLVSQARLAYPAATAARSADAMSPKVIVLAHFVLALQSAAIAKRASARSPKASPQAATAKRASSARSPKASPQAATAKRSIARSPKRTPQPPPSTRQPGVQSERLRQPPPRAGQQPGVQRARVRSTCHHLRPSTHRSHILLQSQA
eukprot:6471149-Amphidinium_carterae.1